MLNKTKAALQSRSCQLTTSNSSFQDITAIDQVNSEAGNPASETVIPVSLIHTAICREILRVTKSHAQPNQPIIWAVLNFYPTGGKIPSSIGGLDSQSTDTQNLGIELQICNSLPQFEVIEEFNNLGYFSLSRFNILWQTEVSWSFRYLLHVAGGAVMNFTARKIIAMMMNRYITLRINYPFDVQCLDKKRNILKATVITTIRTACQGLSIYLTPSKWGNKPVYLQCARYRDTALINSPIQDGDEATTTSSVTPIASLCLNSDGLIGSHPFGSMPRFISSLRANSLNQLLKVILSSLAASFSCCLSSGFMRIWNAGDGPPDFGVRSFTLDIVHTFSLNESHKVCTLYQSGTLKQAPPKGAENTNRGLTKPLIEVTVMAEQQHTQTRPKYQYRFLALCRADMHAKPCRLSVEAETEQDARRVLAPHFILSLAARLPLAEVRHA